jgi:hypothetical protein
VAEMMDCDTWEGIPSIEMVEGESAIEDIVI